MPHEAHSAKSLRQWLSTLARTIMRTAFSILAVASLLILSSHTVQKGHLPEHPAARLSNSAASRLESPQVATGLVLFAVLGFFIFVSLSLVGLHIYYSWDVQRPVAVPPRPFAEPQLQVDSAADLVRLQAEQRKRLMGYAWVDRSRGFVRIPIDRAMDLIIARGADAYAPLEPLAEPSYARTPEEQP